MIEHAGLLRAAANQIDELDAQISALNDDKKLIFANARETVAPAMFKAWRDAVKLRQRRRVDRTALEAHDALVWDVLTVLEAETDQRRDERPVTQLESPAIGLADENPSHVHAHAHDAHEEIPSHDAETGEIIEPPSSSPAAEQAGAELPNVPPTLAAPAVYSYPDPDITLPDFLNRAKRRELEAAE